MSRILLTGLLNDLWPIKLQVLKWLEQHCPSPELAEAKRRIFANGLLKEIYESLDKFDLDSITMYQYTLVIQHPEKANNYLRFLVKIWVTHTADGKDIEKFIVVFDPADRYTTEAIAQKYADLTATDTLYITDESHKSHFSVSNPSTILDPYLQITSVNQAMQNMVEALAHNYHVQPVEPIGMNYMEFISSDTIKRPVEALGQWKASAALAVEGLKLTRRLHLRAHPEDTQRYERKIAELKEKLDWFAELYDAPSYSHLSFPETTEKPLPFCEVQYLVTPPKNPSNIMTLQSYVLLPDYQKRDTTQVTFVPTQGNETSKRLLEQLTKQKKVAISVSDNRKVTA